MSEDVWTAQDLAEADREAAELQELFRPAWEETCRDHPGLACIATAPSGSPQVASEPFRQG